MTNELCKPKSYCNIQMLFELSTIDKDEINDRMINK